MRNVTNNRVRDYTFAAVLSGVLALPVAANAEGTTPTNDAQRQTTEQTFNALDTDRSGVVSEAEYIVHAQEANNIKAEEAAQEFQALDKNNDDRLTLAELKSGADAYKRTIQ